MVKTGYICCVVTTSHFELETTVSPLRGSRVCISHPQLLQKFAKHEVQESPSGVWGVPTHSFSLPRSPSASEQKERKGVFRGTPPLPRQKGSRPPAPPARGFSLHFQFCELFQKFGLSILFMQVNRDGFAAQFECEGDSCPAFGPVRIDSVTFLGNA